MTAKRFQRGWTFLETILVIAIILILTGGVAFVSTRYLERSKAARAQADIGALSMALEAYYLDVGRYPTEVQGLAALFRAPRIISQSQEWRGPYTNGPPGTDPWGRDYRYRVPGPHGLPYELLSLGADGIPGGTGPNTDIGLYGAVSGRI